MSARENEREREKVRFVSVSEKGLLRSQIEFETEKSWSGNI